MFRLNRVVRCSNAILLAGCIWLAITPLSGCAVVGVSLPSSEHTQAVGRQTIVLFDSSRSDPWISERNEPRIVIVKAWFPAAPRGDESRAPYVVSLDSLPGKFAFGERDVAGRVRSRVLHEPPVAHVPGGLPVVLFSPGADMPPDYYAGILEDLAARGYMVLAMDHAHEGRGQVLPDGRTLAVESERFRPPMMDQERYRSFYRQRVDVRAADAAFLLTRLQSGAASLHMLVPHLDLTRLGIAYSRLDRARNISVWTVGADGTGAAPLTHFPTNVRAQVPAWSPNGRIVAFQASEPSAADATKRAAHIWLVDIETQVTTKLASFDRPHLDEVPCWFPDGQRIAFQSDRSGTMEIWVMKVDGTNARQLTRSTSP